VYMGVDVHKNYCQFHVLDDNGKIFSKAKVVNTPDSLTKYVQGLPNESKQAVLEAGYGWMPVHDTLSGLGVSVCLAHPKKTKAIADARIKTDKIDAQALAELLYQNYVPKVWIPDQQTRRLRELTRHRMLLVHNCTRLKNNIHNYLSRIGVQAPRLANLFTKPGIKFLQGIALDEQQRFLLDSKISSLLATKQQVKIVTERIQETGTQDKRVTTLTKIQGIGLFGALVIVSEIGDIERFEHPKKLCSWAGMVPSVSQSGNKTVYGHITKHGNAYLRWILVQCTHASIRYPGYLQSRYYKIMHKRGSKAATIACARKLLTKIWYELKRAKQ